MIFGRRCSPDTRLTCPHGTRHLTADKDPPLAEEGAAVAVALARTRVLVLVVCRSYCC